MARDPEAEARERARGNARLGLRIILGGLAFGLLQMLLLGWWVSDPDDLPAQLPGFLRTGALFLASLLGLVANELHFRPKH